MYPIMEILSMHLIREKEHTRSRPFPYVSHFHHQLTIKQDYTAAVIQASPRMYKRSPELLLSFSQNSYKEVRPVLQQLSFFW